MAGNTPINAVGDAMVMADAARFRRLVEDAPVVSWELDLGTSCFTYVSPQAVELLGYPLELWLQNGFWGDHIHPDDREVAINQHATATARGDDRVLEYRMLSADGRVVWIRDMISVHGDEVGLQTLRGVMIDITERRLVEEALRATIDKLTRCYAELERFAYVASHDLQESLRTIVGFSRLIDCRLARHPEPEVHHFLALVVAAGQRIHSLIGDMLAQIRSGGELAPLKEVSLTEVARSAIAQWRKVVEDVGGDILLTPLPNVCCDRQRLLHVFANLIGNAVTFRHSDRPLVIRIACEEFDEVVAVAVEDNGIGFNPHYVDCAFEAFKRHRRDRSESAIGLAAVRRNVEMHGGKVWVDSRPGEGCAVHFTLPRGII